MQMASAILSRPGNIGSCTCPWTIYNDGLPFEERHYANYAASLFLSDTDRNILNSAHTHGHADHSTSLLPGSYPVDKESEPRTQRLVVKDNRTDTALALPNDSKRKQSTKQLAERPIPDVPIRRLKKVLAKSSEHKLRELVSYKAELLNCIRVLVPKHRTRASAGDVHAQTNADSFGQSILCMCCLTRLTSYLYFSPAARSPYLYEHSVPSYLALIDDARVSIKTDMTMEQITHDELGSILQAELSVVEWRLSLKLARFNKKTGYLDVFPMEVGEYADLEIKRALNKPSDGILMTIWKKIRHVN